MALAACAAARATIAFGQVDDFQDGTLMNWGGGDSLQNIANGGPGGAGDRFLQAQSFGGIGGGSHLAILNNNQWTGDYRAAGVDRVTLFMRNLGNTDLSMRVVLFDFDGGETQWTSTNANLLPAGSGWTPMSFSLRQSDLTQVEGAASYSDAITHVQRFMFRNQAGAPSNGGDAIVATAGFDNITAVPEPASLLALAAGAGALLRRRRKQ